MRLLEQLNAIESGDGTNVKKALLKNVSPLVKDAFVYAMQPSLVFHTSGPPHSYSNNEYKTPDDEFLVAFYIILDHCAKGTLRGNAADDAIANLWVHGDELQRKWGQRILGKNLRCGIGWGSFTEVFPGLLKGFRAQLCGSYGGGGLRGLWYADAKFDGMRCYMVFQEDGSVEVLSRSGKPVPGGLEIAKKLAVSTAVRGHVLDGELFSTDRFKSIGQSRSHSGSREGLRFFVFDVLKLGEWQKQSIVALMDRVRYWEDILRPQMFTGLPTCDLDLVQDVPRIELTNPNASTIQKVMMDFKAQGFEGAVLKNAESPYDFTRSGHWLKAKPVETGDFPLVDVLRGNGRLANTAGKLIVDVGGVKVGVGTGLSDNDRRMFWDNRELLVNQRAIIEVGFEGKTPDGSLNFPRFLKLRTDKAHEENQTG